MTFIDFHAHHFPVGLPNMAERTGDTRWTHLVTDERPRLMHGDKVFRPVKPACFDPAARIAELAEAGCDAQVISPVPITFVDWAPAADANMFLKAQNDGLSHVAADSSGKLIALGAVPLQDTDLAIGEMLRTKQDLGMAGIEIPASVAGRELDDESLSPFWEAAEAEQVPIFIHPAHQKTAIRRTGQPIEFGLGMLTDTAIAATALVYGGVLERFPGLRIALSHGCGTFGWAHPRLRYFAASTKPSEAAHLDELVRSLWVDTLVFDPLLLGVLCDRFGPDHILFGTDHPFLPDCLSEQRLIVDEAIEQHDDLTDSCLGSNAARFLNLPEPSKEA